MRRRPVLVLLALPLACADAPAGGDADDGAGTMLPASSTGDTGLDDATTWSASSETAATDEADDGSTGEPPPPVVPGLRAEYFAEYHDPVLVRIEPSIDADWGMGAPDPSLPVDRFSIRWTGWLTAPSSGTWTIITDADDGVRVRIGEAAVIDDWIPHYVTRNSGTIDLVGGVPIPIEITYFEIDIAASMKLSWAGPDGAESVIGPAALTTQDVASGLPGPTPPYANPVVPFDCPDPGVIALDDAEPPGFYMVCTGGSFPIRWSHDLVLWHDTGASVLPEGKPPWAANGGRNWAPELHRVGDRVVAYFTTVNGANVLSIGAAWADDVHGPYTDAGGPLVEHGQGVIDATFVEDGASKYLVYKIDGNAHGQPTPIFLQQLTDDGLALAPGSSPTQILVNDPGTWEAGVVEAPYFARNGGSWYVFYSGNVYDSRYRTGVARSATLAGPYEKHGAPILANNERWVGPGHGTVLSLPGGDYFFYHAWTNAGDGSQLASAGRQGLVDRIAWQDGWPQIADGTPSHTLEPWPQ